MYKLKPCPFCGATESSGMISESIVPVESFLKAKTVEFYTVKCHCCGCKVGNHNTKDDAISAWNRRVNNDSEKV